MPREIVRKYVRADDLLVMYSSHANIVSTGSELVMTLYDVIPPFPDELKEGAAPDTAEAITRMRVCVTMSPSHALEIGKILTKQASDVLSNEAGKEGE